MPRNKGQVELMRGFVARSGQIVEGEQKHTEKEQRLQETQTMKRIFSLFHRRWHILHISMETVISRLFCAMINSRHSNTPEWRRAERKLTWQEERRNNEPIRGSRALKGSTRFKTKGTSQRASNVPLWESPCLSIPNWTPGFSRQANSQCPLCSSCTY